MISTESLMVLAALLFVKHLIADGPLQTRYMLRHKGDFLHPGGLLHAFVHVALTLVCLLIWCAHSGIALERTLLPVMVGVVVLEYVSHYLADWLKVQVDRRYGWSSITVGEDGRVTLTITSSNYFIAFLADQTVHSLTYVAMLYLLGVGL